MESQNFRINNSDETAPMFAWWALGLGLGSLILLASAGPGYRLGFWGYKAGFRIMEWAGYGGISALGIGAIALVKTFRGPKKALLISCIGLAAGMLAFWTPWNAYHKARTFPAINDITTDTQRPPEFVSSANDRKLAGGHNQYPGGDTAEMQGIEYPDIKPLQLSKNASDAFDDALTAAKDMGWKVTASNRETGVIEAIDTTFWFGFKDDVAIRITPGDGKSRVDVRSSSRVGTGDAGRNAQRIREYLGHLNKKA